MSATKSNNANKSFKIFVENIWILYRLNAASSFKVLFAILDMATAKDNVVCLAFGMRSRICQTIGMHLNVFARALRELIDNEILIKTENKDYFILNPYIFWQGSLKNAKKLRLNMVSKSNVNKDSTADIATNKNINTKTNIDKTKYYKMIASFEVLSKMLDTIKDLETNGRKDEAMALQKTMQQYLNNFSQNN